MFLASLVKRGIHPPGLKGVVIIYVEGVLVNRENKDWRLF
jgi:hypothetical protein